MPAIQLEVELTVEQLLQAIEQLMDDELIQFETEYPKRILKRLSEIDTMLDLHSAIAYRFPKEKQERLDDLIDKNNDGKIYAGESNRPANEAACCAIPSASSALEKTFPVYWHALGLHPPARFIKPR